jgi:hypothetical protein
MNSFSLEQGLVTCFCKYGNEHYSSTNGGKFVELLSDCQLLKKSSPPRGVCYCDCRPEKYLRHKFGQQ